QIAGWGLPTIRGIRYSSEFSCNLSTGCGRVLTHQRIDTSRGDGTVVIPSATALNVETFYFNLPAYNRGFTRDRDHASMMGAEPVRDLIKSLLEGNRNPLISYISKSEPIGAKWVRVILRSPVALIGSLLLM